MKLYKQGAVGSDAADVICLSTQVTTDAYYVALWKPGVAWTVGNAYQIPSGKKLSVVAWRAALTNNTFQSFSFSLGYGDNAQPGGIGGSGTAPTNAVSVYGDTAGASVATSGGFVGYMDGGAGTSLSIQPMSFIAHDMWPSAAATKYPFVKFRSSVSTLMSFQLWVLEV